MGFKSTLISLILAGVVIFAIFSFGIQTGISNNAEINLLNNSKVSSSYSNLSSNLGDVQGSYQNQSANFAGTQPESNGDSILIVSIAGIWSVLQGIPILIYQSTVGLVFTVLFGGDSSSGFAIVIGSVGAILILIITLYAWKLIRTGDPD